MNAVRTSEQRDIDLELEIDATYDRMIAEPDEAKARAIFHEMALLLYRRSPQQIHKMELERRLYIKKAKA